MAQDRYRSLRLGALLLFGVALAGCGPGGAWMLTGLALLVLTLAGCSESHEMGRGDAAVPIDAPPVIGADGGGSWETCCESGRLSTCFCPAGAACNYGMGLVVCDDGSCGYGFDPASVCAPDGGTDAGIAEDAGEPGTWEACCNEGRIEMCFCPAGAICNYGLFDDCGEGYCTYPGGTCPAAE